MTVAMIILLRVGLDESFWSPLKRLALVEPKSGQIDVVDDSGNMNSRT